MKPFKAFISESVKVKKAGYRIYQVVGWNLYIDGYSGDWRLLVQDEIGLTTGGNWIESWPTKRDIIDFIDNKDNKSWLLSNGAKEI